MKKRQPEVKIEATPNGVTRIRCLFSGDAQKREVFALAGRLLPSIAKLDEVIKKNIL